MTTGFEVHRGLTSDESYRNAAAVTPHDSNELATYSRALYVGVAGDVKVTHIEGGVVTYKAVPVGVHKLAVKLVWSTGTAATNILALW